MKEEKKVSRRTALEALGRIKKGKDDKIAVRKLALALEYLLERVGTNEDETLETVTFKEDSIPIVIRHPGRQPKEKVN